MSQLPYANNYRDLIVYQKSRQLAYELFQISVDFPREEMHSLTDQIRRSSRSIGAQIAEAWAKRRYERHFVSKLTDADGEQQETRHWIRIALDCGYLSIEQAKDLRSMCVQIGQLLNGMIIKSQLFCGQPVKVLREAEIQYFVNQLPADPDD